MFLGVGLNVGNLSSGIGDMESSKDFFSINDGQITIAITYLEEEVSIGEQ